MQRKYLIPIILIIITAIMTVVSFIVLPETVIIQFSFGLGANTTVTRLLAILIPFVIGTGGAVLSIILGANDKTRIKCYFVSAVGILIFLILITVNVIFKV